MEKLEKLWQTQKTICIIIGIILFPITLFILGTRLYMMYNEFIAKKSIENAQKKDDKLALEESVFKKTSDSAVAKANKAAERIENRKDDETDLDWHIKRKD